MRAENRHYTQVHKAKEHPASKCRKPKCVICHYDKVLDLPTLQLRKQIEKERLND